MPVKSVESSPGHRVMEYRCEICGEYACFGFGARILDALRTGDVRRAGRWYCVDHVPGEPAAATGGDLFGRVA